ncbi:winged helix-turn-helix domain-containing protein [Streptomyces kronopolitis]|uniref:winged helix-turn-helix domain-containing protein n=1 Tax=Streptomyces kronopolitis TaxID=1612435 RepID=UPI003683DAAA
MPEPEYSLTPLLTDPTRLSIVALLANSKWPEFSFVRDGVGISDSALSKQVSLLEKSQYVEVKKGYVGKRPRTWINITRAGLQALNHHIRALQHIADQASERLA